MSMYRMVPVEPTDKMQVAFRFSYERAGGPSTGGRVRLDFRAGYAAMLAAAPRPTAVRATPEEIAKTTVTDEEMAPMQAKLIKALEEQRTHQRALAGEIAYQLTKMLVVDISTARAAVDAAYEKASHTASRMVSEADIDAEIRRTGSLRTEENRAVVRARLQGADGVSAPAHQGGSQQTLHHKGQP